MLDVAGIGNSQDILHHFICCVVRRVSWQATFAMPAQVKGDNGETLAEASYIARSMPLLPVTAPAV
jgi:hypothetical protein